MGICKYCGQSAGLLSSVHKECETRHLDLAGTFQHYLKGGMRWSYDTLHNYVKELCPGSSDEEIEKAYCTVTESEWMALQSENESLRQQLRETSGDLPDEAATPLNFFWLSKLHYKSTVRTVSLERMLTKARASSEKGILTQQEEDVTALKQHLDQVVEDLDWSIENDVPESENVDPDVVADLVQAIWYYRNSLKMDKAMRRDGLRWSLLTVKFQMQAQMAVTDEEVELAYGIASDPDVVDQFEELWDLFTEALGWGTKEMTSTMVLDLIGQSRQDSRARHSLTFPYVRVPQRAWDCEESTQIELEM